jgi:hypothetical protein
MTFIRTLPSALALASFMLLGSAQTHAHVIDTQGSIGGLAGSNTVDASNWLAERFTLSTSALIDSVSTFVLSSDAGNDLGKSFTLAVYANSGTNRPALDWFANNQGQLFQTTITYNGDGWNGASALNWQLAAGSYWFALEADGNGPSGLQVPSGAMPAATLVAGYNGVGSGYSTQGYSPADTFGLRVTAAVPEPEGWALAVIGLLAVGSLVRRRA